MADADIRPPPHVIIRGFSQFAISADQPIISGGEYKDAVVVVIEGNVTLARCLFQLPGSIPGDINRL
jgi:hypothetical protein